MSLAPIDDDVIDKKPDQKKKAVLQKPWFNWWSMPIASTLGLGVLVLIRTGRERVMQPDPFPSKDIAETAAQKLIDEHETYECSCGFGPDCYIGAYEEGKSPP